MSDRSLAGLPVGMPKDFDRFEAEFRRYVESLSGFPYPSDAPQWIKLLTMAGFNQPRIEQVLCYFGYYGFDDVAELPAGYMSVPARGTGPTFTDTLPSTAEPENWPTFSAMLISGLEHYAHSRMSKKENGPDNTGNFWWDDVPYHIPGKGGDLMAFIFEHQPVSDQQIADDFYEQSDKPYDSIRREVNRINNALLELGAPIQVDRGKNRPSQIIRIPDK